MTDYKLTKLNKIGRHSRFWDTMGCRFRILDTFGTQAKYNSKGQQTVFDLAHLLSASACPPALPSSLRESPPRGTPRQAGWRTL